MYIYSFLQYFINGIQLFRIIDDIYAIADEFRNFYRFFVISQEQSCNFTKFCNFTKLCSFTKFFILQNFEILQKNFRQIIIITQNFFCTSTPTFMDYKKESFLNENPRTKYVSMYSFYFPSAYSKRSPLCCMHCRSHFC